MKYLTCILILLFTLSKANSQDLDLKSDLHLSKFLNTTDSINREIIKRFDQFLISKDSSLFQNRAWLKSDFDNYRYPYIDLFRIDYERNEPKIYNTDLLQIIKTEKSRTN